jgi:hypothetical protein
MEKQTIIVELCIEYGSDLQLDSNSEQQVELRFRTSILL